MDLACGWLVHETVLPGATGKKGRRTLWWSPRPPDSARIHSSTYPQSTSPCVSIGVRRAYRSLRSPADSPHVPQLNRHRTPSFGEPAHDPVPRPRGDARPNHPSLRVSLRRAGIANMSLDPPARVSLSRLPYAVADPPSAEAPLPTLLCLLRLYLNVIVRGKHHPIG